MGFRSILSTTHCRFKISDKFREEYQWLNIPEQDEDGYCYGSITAKLEIKFYNELSETKLFLDLQKCIVNETDYEREIIIILLHECGGITRVKITSKEITGKEPTEWKEVKEVEHNYCYGCSDLTN